VRAQSNRIAPWARYSANASLGPLSNSANSTPPRRRCATENCSNSAITAHAPRCAAASITTAAVNIDAAATATTATAGSAATATTSAATTTTSATAATMASAAAAAARHLCEASGAVFLVKKVECRKTYIRHFLFAKNKTLIGCGVQRLRNVGGRKSGCGCASHQRKTQSSSTQRRYAGGFGQALSLRSLLHPGHVASSLPVFSSSQKILRLARPSRKLEQVH
jgi:hypothetical protein